MSKQQRDNTISFRPSNWQRALIEKRAELSGHYKKDFIARSCIYSNIVVVGKKENVQYIVDELQSMKYTLEEIAREIKSGDFSLSDETYEELKLDYFALLITAIDILNGAAYLFEKVPDSDNQHWKTDLELEELREVLRLETTK